MATPVVPVQVRAVLPTSGGCAVFLGNEEKVFVIYIDQSVGAAISMFMRDTVKDRPLTHDLMANLLTALGGRVDRVVINELKQGTYHARIIITAENELHLKKIVELDARSSDAVAMATQQKAPIYVNQEVWEEVEDVSEVLAKMEQSESEGDEDPGGEDSGENES